MALRDLIAAEIADSRTAADAAAIGQSITGFSGRHADLPADGLFGGRVEPIVGAKVASLQVRNLATAGAVQDAIENDPIFRRSREQLKPRQPFGAASLKLAVTPRAGYRRYWFNDSPGRVAAAKRAGYNHVMDPDRPGEVTCIVTDKADGRGRSSYLMEIPMECYQDDMAEQADAHNRLMSDIRDGRAGPGADDNRYVKKISITGR